MKSGAQMMRRSRSSHCFHLKNRRICAIIFLIMGWRMSVHFSGHSAGGSTLPDGGTGALTEIPCGKEWQSDDIESNTSKHD
jgi:hypothetical protein